MIVLKHEKIAYIWKIVDALLILGLRDNCAKGAKICSVYAIFLYNNYEDKLANIPNIITVYHFFYKFLEVDVISKCIYIIIVM